MVFIFILQCALSENAYDNQFLISSDNVQTVILYLSIFKIYTCFHNSNSRLNFSLIFSIGTYYLLLLLYTFKIKMYEPTLKNLTNVDYGKPPDCQNQVSY